MDLKRSLSLRSISAVKCKSASFLEKNTEKERESTLGQREKWWRIYLRPTPIPGTYAVRDFLQEAQLNPVKPTYSFKGEGRRRIPIYERTVDNSLPNVSAYVPPTFIDLLGKKLATYSFKNLPRRSPSTLCFKDKDTNIAPGQYDISSPPVPMFASKQFMFRSAVQRSSSNYFTPEFMLNSAVVLVIFVTVDRPFFLWESICRSIIRRYC